MSNQPAHNLNDLALDALGNPVRRRIVTLLSQQPTMVGDLAEQFTFSRPAMSKHLKVLENAGLVTHQQRGTRNVYCIDPRGFAAARAWLDQFWDEALENFRAVAEQSQGTRHDE